MVQRLILFFALGYSYTSLGVGWKRRLQLQEEGDGLEAAAAQDGPAPSRLRQRTNPRRGGPSSSAEAAGSSSDAANTRTYPLTKSLQKKWASGKLSAKEVQEFALSAMSQGAYGLENLAAIGNWGTNPQNMQRALIGVFGHPPGAPPFTLVEIPTKHGTRTPHPFLLPHLFFQHYYSEQRDKWVQAMRGSPRAPAQFWEKMRNSDYFAFHPNAATQQWGRTIPLGLHGDGGAFSGHDSLMTISWNSLLGNGPTIAKRFLITVVKKSDMTPATLDAIFKVASWSFNVLLSGQTPSHNYYGMPILQPIKPLADGWSGALCQVRGDWQFYCEAFYFPQWNGADEMCWLCRASSVDPTRSWTDCRPEAGWRETRWTHQTYMEHLRLHGRAVPILLGIHGVIGLTLSCIMIDVLHSVDQGVSAHIIGNILWICAIVRTCFGGTNMIEKAKRLDAHLRGWYNRTRCSSRLDGKMTVERLRATTGSWPKLRAKAAATRKLSLYALELAGSVFTADTDEDRTILEIIRLLVRFYQILDSESMFLSEVARAELPVLGQRLAELYSKLASSAYGLGLKLWKMSPKLHLWEHLTEWQCLYAGNPRFYWTYADEDLVGHMIEIAESCHPCTLAITVLVKWLHLYFDE